MRPRFLLPVLIVCVAASARPALCQNRGGFTLLLTLGYGIQSGEFVSPSANSVGVYQTMSPEAKDRTGLAGLNIGIGGFVSKDTALMLRFSGTNADANYRDFVNNSKTTEVVAGTMTFDVQYWMEDRWNVEAGVGWGFLDTGLDDYRGLGLFGAIGYSFLLRGSHSLQVGIEDALYHDSDRDINSIGLCIGFQFL